MYTIRKSFSFSASHQLDGLPKDHPCSQLHGHNYEIIVELQSRTLDIIGFIKDYRELDVIKKWIDDKVDHKHLNDVLNFNPTAEKMAYYFFYEFRHLLGMNNGLLYAVEVSETPKTLARYES